MSSLMVCLRQVQQFCMNCCCPQNVEDKDANSMVSEDDRSTCLMFDLSKELERKMEDAGFTQGRVDYHIALVSFLEEEYLRKDRDKERRLCGSYAEGWGFNTSVMDGTVTQSSNVNIMSLIRFGGHFNNCACQPPPGKPLMTVTEVSDGYCQGAFGKDKDIPISTFPMMSSCPNVEESVALAYSCIPATCTLFSKPRLSANLLLKCKQAGIVIVNTRRPWEVRQEFRISYSLMERELVRHFTEPFGRSLIFLKFFFKTRLRGYGIKSYVAKSLMFYILAECEETLIWPNKGSVMDLVLRAIRLLIHFLQSYCPEKDEVCMPHFFHDSPILFRATERPNKKDVVLRLEAEIDLLEDTVILFMRQLRPPASDAYYCQPGSIFAFSSTPVHTLLNNRVLRNLDESFPLPSYVESVQSHWQDISTNVLMAMNPASHGPFSVRLTVEMLSPKQHSIRLALEVLLLIEEGYQERAVQLLNESLHHKPKHLKVKSNWHKDDLKNEFTRHFHSEDSNWCIYFKNRHSEYLPSIFHELFIRKEVAINFTAVLKTLRRQMIGEQFKETDWFVELQQDEYLDAQEIFAFAMTCKSVKYLEWSVKMLDALPNHEKQKETMMASISTRLDNIKTKTVRFV